MYAIRILIKFRFRKLYKMHTYEFFLSDELSIISITFDSLLGANVPVVNTTFYENVKNSYKMICRTRAGST